MPLTHRNHTTRRAAGSSRVVTRMWHTREIFSNRTQSCICTMRFAIRNAVILGPRDGGAYLYTARPLHDCRGSDGESTSSRSWYCWSPLPYPGAPGQLEL